MFFSHSNQLNSEVEKFISMDCSDRLDPKPPVFLLATAKNQMTDNSSANLFNAYKEKFSRPDLVFSHTWKSLAEIKDTCLISLDTNVLLAPYNLRKESIDEIEKIYSALQKQNRLFLSAHAVREFAANKSSKLSEIHQGIFERKIKLKPAPEYPILFDLPEYELLNRYTKEIKGHVDTYNSSLDAIAEKIKGWVWHDPVVQMYTKVYSQDMIVDHKLSDEAFAADLNRRSKFKIPPGYKDASKVENSEGDLSIWHTLLEVGRNKEADIVFVSEDRKPDWWNRSSGTALTPKYELIHEFQNETKGKNIHLLIFSEFLKAFEVPQDVIDDVKSEELRLKEKSMTASKRYKRTPRAHLLALLEARGIDTHTCSVCGFQGNPEVSILEIHHILPLRDGGDESADNLVVLCPNCHSIAHSKSDSNSI